MSIVTWRYMSLLALIVVLGYGTYAAFLSDADNDAIDGRTSTSYTILRRGNGGDPESLDPATAEDNHAFNVLTDLYEGLLAIDAGGRIIPGVASRWEVSSDGLEHTFHLREDARWSDGRRVVAGEFVAGLQRALDPATASAYSFLLHPIRHAEAVARGDRPADAIGVAAPDDATLVIELEAPTPYFLSVLTMPIAFPQHPGTTSFSDPAQFIGNGPFVLAEWQVGGRIRLLRNPVFHAADTVALDEVQYFPVTDLAVELNLYRTGELDITNSVPDTQLEDLRAARPGELRIAPSLGLYYLAFDMSEPPLDNGALRKALSMAIDRDALTRLLGRGEQPAWGLVPDGVAGYTPARVAWRELSQDERQQRARALYAGAGYSADNPLRVTLLYDTGDVHERVALAVASMWQEALGADVELDKREWKDFLATRLDRDEWQVMRFAWTADFDHPATFTDILRPGHPQNLSRYANERYAALLDAAALALEGGEQMALYRSAEALALEDDPTAPLYFYVSKHLVAPGIEGFEDNGLDRHPSRYLRRADAPRR